MPHRHAAAGAPARRTCGSAMALPEQVPSWLPAPGTSICPGHPLPRASSYQVLASPTSAQLCRALGRQLFFVFPGLQRRSENSTCSEVRESCPQGRLPHRGVGARYGPRRSSAPAWGPRMSPSAAVRGCSVTMGTSTAGTTGINAEKSPAALSGRQQGLLGCRNLPLPGSVTSHPLQHPAPSYLFPICEADDSELYTRLWSRWPRNASRWRRCARCPARCWGPATVPREPHGGRGVSCRARGLWARHGAVGNARAPRSSPAQVLQRPCQHGTQSTRQVCTRDRIESGVAHSLLIHSAT